jgi:SnoaL-like domain
MPLFDACGRSPYRPFGTVPKYQHDSRLRGRRAVCFVSSNSFNRGLIAARWAGGAGPARRSLDVGASEVHMLTRRQITRWAELWISCWNDRDVETLLTYFRDDVRFESPLAEGVTGSPVLEGRDALRRYWTETFRGMSGLRFDLERVIWDPAAQEVAVVYAATLEGIRIRGCGLFVLDDRGRITRGEACYGSTVGWEVLSPFRDVAGPVALEGGL